MPGQVAATRRGERISQALPGRWSGITPGSSIDDGLTVVNAYAAEHLTPGRLTPPGTVFQYAAAAASRVRPAGPGLGL
ncbi:hypothetical protein AB0K60_18280 [Thermopolyspora sp. NPDC052614]|uniref:hypothetical protein n=1 Tax=Thermopolyspora sp. NPDC052614 TaxID=3155682 RepID=UPI00342AF611